MGEQTGGDDLTDVTVSVVVPMRNEAKDIGACLAGFEAQTWPLDRLDLVVVDGASDDGSRRIVEDLTATRPWIRIVDNPALRASAAFNRGIAATTGEVVCLFSSHGVPDPDYLANSVETLRRSRAAGVGGPIRIDGWDPRSRAVGLALASPFGMASPFRYSTTVTEVDTIGHPAYLRSTVDAVGPFDESLERNSDYEYNWRIRAQGMRLVFDSAIGSSYAPRPGIAALARQFWAYGRWKAEVVRRHPASVRPRQLVPPAFVAWLLLTPVLLLQRPTRRLLLLSLGLYAAGVAGSVLHARRTDPRHPVDLAALVAAFPTMHLSWGAGFLVSLLAPPAPTPGPDRPTD